MEMSEKGGAEEGKNEVEEPDNDSCLGKFKYVHPTNVKLKIKKMLPSLFVVGWLIYVGCVIYFHPNRSSFVCIITVIVLYIYLNGLTKGKVKRLIRNAIKRTGKCCKPCSKHCRWTRRIMTIVCVIGIFAFLVIDIWDRWHNWIPLGGLTFFVVISVIFSKHPTKINWTPVIWGIIMQFCLGLFILRWERGFAACQFVGNQVTIMLKYADEGSKFVFGEQYSMHPFAFKMLPVIVYVGAFVMILYYLGAMQVTIKAIAIVLQYVLDTTPIESFATSAHIFFGLAETAIALKPFWADLTVSEIHAAMCSGYATVAGFVIAIFVEFGIPAEHVISASFMSAPAALAIAKISLPETEVSKIKSQKEIQIPTGQQANLLEAASVGATSAIEVIGYIAVNLIAFIGILAFLDASMSYFGSLVNYPELSFQRLFSYLFMPLAAVIGIPWSEAFVVGGLLGKKIFVNGFLPLAELGGMMKSGSIDERAGVLATYALCGFGAIPAIGIYLGTLASAAPERRSDFAKVALRALINGNIACYMTACIAGLIYHEQQTNAFLKSAINETTDTGLLSNTTTNMTGVLS